MPEAQDEDRRGRDFVAHLIVADDDPANLTWLIGFQLFADPRIIEQPVRRVGELLEVEPGWETAVETVLGTLLVMWLAGIELERISLGALIIAMGMLVDNAVVVCDGMLVRQRQGKSILEASQETLQQTQWPLLGATIIGILAFAGIGLSQDTTGEFLFSLFFVIAVSLLLSWLLALLLVPLFGHYLLRNAGADEEADAAYDGPWYARYRRLATGVLRRPKLTIGALLVLTVISAVIFTRLPQSFFPPSSTPLFYVNLFLPQGTHIHETARTAGEVEAYLQELDGVSDVSTFVGAGASRFMLTYAPEQPNSSLMHLLVHTEDAEVIAGLVREVNQTLPGHYPAADVAAAQFLFGPNAEAKLEARISGPELGELRRLSAEGQRLLQEQGQVFNIRDDWRAPVPVLRPRLDLDRLADAGLTRQAVARALGAAIALDPRQEGAVPSTKGSLKG